MPDLGALQRIMRLKNIFGSQGEMIGNDLPSQGGITGNMDFEPTDADVEAAVTSKFQPEHEMSDRLSSMLDTYPERNKPGMLRKIGAALVGASGGNVEHALYAPYYRELEDWKTKITPTMQASTQERLRNTNERTRLYQQESLRLREEAQKHKANNDEAKAEIARKRAEVYEYKAKNPDLDFDFKGPTIKSINPKTGEVKDTGVPTGSMSELDKINLQHKNRLEEIGRTGSEARKTEELRQTGREEVIEKRGEEARKTKEVPSGTVTKTGAAKPELPTQTRVRQFNSARELFNSRKDLRPFIKIGSPGSNDFSITPPGTNFMGSATGPTKEQYDEINEKIYGKKEEKKPTTPAAGRGAPPPNTLPKKSKYKVTIS